MNWPYLIKSAIAFLLFLVCAAYTLFYLFGLFCLITGRPAPLTAASREDVGFWESLRRAWAGY